MSKIALPLLLLPLLAGCAVVDLAAHGMKQYEKSKQPAAQQQTATAEPEPVSSPDTVPSSEPEPVMAAPSSGGSIKAQSLD
ncbi:MAG: hypothetical protein HYU59_11280 [Magnetospirillum gryphiswaldense]|nr:hypothetical protein [Magnetospirillum gryphiswaldense]